MISRLLLGMLPLLQEDGFPNPPGQLEVFAQADVWFASIESSGRLENWFGKKGVGEEEDPRMSFHREGRLRDPAPVTGLEVAIVGENEKHQWVGFRACVRYGTWSESGAVDAAFTIDGTTVPAGSRNVAVAFPEIETLGRNAKKMADLGAGQAG